MVKLTLSVVSSERVSFELLLRSVSLNGADVTDATIGPDTPNTEAKSLFEEVGVDVPKGF